MLSRILFPESSMRMTPLLSSSDEFEDIDITTLFLNGYRHEARVLMNT